MHFKIALLVFKAVVQLLYVSSMLCRYLQSLLRFRFHVRIGIIFKPPQITDGPLRPTLTKCGIIMKMNERNGMPHEKKCRKKT